MKYVRFLSITIILLCLYSCTKGGNDLKINISPTDQNLIDLSAQIYEDSKLLDIINFNGLMSELDQLYPIECLREVNGIYRASYQGVEKVAILLFDHDGNKIVGNIYNAQKRKSDFEELVEGQSLEDVQKIDPKGNYLFLYTGRNDTPKLSSHYTKDGYLITIGYDATNIIISIQEELI